MLFWSLIVLTILGWSGMVVAYFWEELTQWFDNKFGPATVVKKNKPPRRRMYD